MTERQTLSQYKLANFLACQRRFQLRYLRRLPWPASPLSERTEQLLQQGQDFHQLLERHFLGLTIDKATIENGRVRHWWQTFQTHNPAQHFPSNARFLPETGLTVPLRNHLLYGRFDLLVIGEDEAGRPFAHLFDWKTGRPIEAAELNGRWQTRLYLALLAEGSNAFWPQAKSISPEQIRLTYWFVQEPDAPATIGYSAAAHAANWGELQQFATQLDETFALDAWPLTDDWNHCRECAYQNYCGRQAAGTATPELDEAEEPDILNEQLLTPELP
ncbi:PD-(D/E)XK nuclease family protein [Candidatus Leptofilum sp.]|uniref:PD-(D/E)XK nuclease family protein n=1 Tax=Candidatus Leptofilum sp. TaxID=3241576 RepID=UPI003B5AAD31